MKLYTEEQVIQAFNYGKTLEPFDCIKDMIDSLTPIELPSDDSILAQAKDVFSNSTIWAPGEQLVRCAAYEHGAHWVIDQIKQQAKKHGKSETEG